MTAKFKEGDIVEDISKGDLPFMVLAVQDDEHVPRYTVRSITDVQIANFPEYLLVAARPPGESKYGGKK